LLEVVITFLMITWEEGKISYWMDKSGDWVKRHFAGDANEKRIVTREGEQGE